MRGARRADGDGLLVALDQQDRSRWDWQQIDEGMVTLARRLGPPWSLPPAGSASRPQPPGGHRQRDVGSERTRLVLLRRCLLLPDLPDALEENIEIERLRDVLVVPCGQDSLPVLQRRECRQGHGGKATP